VNSFGLAAIIFVIALLGVGYLAYTAGVREGESRFGDSISVEIMTGTDLVTLEKMKAALVGWMPPKNGKYHPLETLQTCVGRALNLRRSSISSPPSPK